MSSSNPFTRRQFVVAGAATTAALLLSSPKAAFAGRRAAQGGLVRSRAAFDTFASNASVPAVVAWMVPWGSVRGPRCLPRPRSC